MLARVRSILSLALALTLAGCATFTREMAYETRASVAMSGTVMEHSVLVPRDLQADEHLPIVLFLHGGGDGPDCLDRHGVSGRIVEAMERGELPRMVIVVPQGDLGLWADWHDGSRFYERWAIEALARARRRYHTARCPTGCHLVGISMGADGASRMALHHPGLFSSVAIISGPALDTDRRIAFANDPLISILVPTHRIFGPTTPRSRVERDDPFVRWRDPSSLMGTRLLVAWGTRDRDFVISGSEALHAHLEAHAIEHETLVFEGEHAWSSWSGILLDVLRRQIAPTE